MKYSIYIYKDEKLFPTSIITLLKLNFAKTINYEIIKEVGYRDIILARGA